MSLILNQAPTYKKKRAQIGVKSSASGKSIVKMNKPSGGGILRLEILGRTENDISTGSNGVILRTSAKNLIDTEKMVELMKKNWSYTKIKEVDGRRCVLFNNAYFHGKDFTSCCPVFKENTRYIFSFYARPNEVLSANATHEGELSLGFKGDNLGQIGNRILSAKKTTDFTQGYAINAENTTVTDISISFGYAYNWLIDLDTVVLYEYEGNNNPVYEAPKIKEIAIPSSVELSDGNELQIALSESERLVFENKSSSSLIYYTEQGSYDLSHTDFAKELAQINAERGTSLEIMVKGAIAPRGLNVTFFSTENEDKAVLKVKYECNGQGISASKEYSVRKGSAYKIIAPHIKGYTPIKAETQGVLNESTEIILTYKER